MLVFVACAVVVVLVDQLCKRLIAPARRNPLGALGALPVWAGALMMAATVASMVAILLFTQSPAVLAKDSASRSAAR